MRWITASQLEGWAGSEPARASLPDLIKDLIWASAREVRTIRFPNGDKSQIHGFDGHLVATGVTDVQDGESFWELGTSQDYVAKANSDIKERSQQAAPELRSAVSFVFVTPRTWNQSGDNELQRWREKKRQEFGWKEVVVIDGVMMEHWLERCPAVAARYARREFGSAPKLGARSTEEFWIEYASRFKAPLTEQVLLCQRGEASKEVLKHLRSGPAELVLRADSPDEAIAFAIATIRTADAEARQFLESRTIVIDADDAARELAERKDLIFIPRGNVTITGQLARRGPTLRAVGRDRPERGAYVRLDPPTSQAFAEALQTMGLREDSAQLLARSCGRSVTILMRLFPNGDAGIPEWVKAERALVPALLAGAWDSAFEEDKKILRGFAEVDAYDKYEEQLRRFQRMDDPPIDREGTVWKVRAPVDAFVHLAHLLGEGDFARLKAAIVEVFSEIDPSLNVESPPKAWDQPKPRHSSWLRDGLATTLLQIAVNHEGAALQIAQTTPQAFVDSLINSLPGLSSDWRLIASIRAELPLLMEAAPRPFLNAIDRLLKSKGNELKNIFREGDFFSTFSPHTYLLWGLEVLAWDPDYLAEVSLILAKLAKIDPGGTLSNRPINALMEIFLPWHPNTNASQEQRLAVLDLIVRDVPEIGWTVISKLLPTMHSVGQYTAEPKYREAGGSSRELLTRGKVVEAYQTIVEKAFALAGKDPERWSYLVRDFANFSPALRSKMSGLLGEYLENALEKDRLRVWETIRDEVNRHFAFKEAKWALPTEDLRPLSQLVERFAPSDPAAKVTWLFDEQFPHLPGSDGDLERVVNDARKRALNELVSAHGIEAVVGLTESVKLPHLIALALPLVMLDVSVYDRLVELALSSGTEKARQFAASLSGVAAERFPDKWASVFRTRAAQTGLSVNETVALLQYWPDKRSTWDFVASLGKELEAAYWLAKQAWPIRGDVDDLVYAAEHYINARRCIAAIQSLGETAGTLPIDLVVRLLNSSVSELNETPNAATGMFTYYLEQILDALEKRGVATTQIAQLEWSFFPLFDYGRRQLRLHRVMLEDPGFYVSLLCAVFRAEGEEPSEPTAEERARATAAYRLLTSFGNVPGRQGDDVDAKQLASWIRDVRRLGEEAGRRGMANEFAGHVLAHAPVDPGDEVWPHRVVRNLIEELSSEETERGIQVERFNMRGAYSKALFEGGKQERGFAEQARAWATKCGAWPRTQRLLNEIAEQWDRHAEWEDSEARKDRMRD